MKTEQQSLKNPETELEQLRQENEMLKMYLEHVGGGVALFGPDCRVIWSTRAAKNSLGLQDPEDVLTFCYEFPLYRPEHCLICPIKKSFEGGQTETREMDVEINPSETRRYLVTANPLQGDRGRVEQVLAMGQDITEYGRVEEVLQIQNRRVIETMRQKSRFFASMSHELRTPLTSIIGFAEILQEDTVEPLAPNQRNLLTKICQSSHKMLGIINDLLDLSKIESGRMTVNLSRVDLPTLVEQIIETMMPLVRDKPLTLAADMADDLPVMRTDEQKLSQILINLISNAIKFTPEGSVTVSARRVGSKVRISVADTGIGIRRADFAKIFEEFGQVDCPGNRRTGTGLGLAITRKLVHILGGDIRVSSKLGNGSTFNVTLPVSLSQSLMEKRLKRIAESTGIGAAASHTPPTAPSASPPSPSPRPRAQAPQPTRSSPHRPAQG